MNRPTGVTVIAILCWIFAALPVIVGLVMFAGGAFLASMKTGPMGGILAGFGAFVAVFFLVLGALYVIVGVGLWKLLNWGRMLCMILVALGLLTSAWGLMNALIHFSIGPLIRQAIVCAIDVWILIYLNKPHVKQAFAK